jgi:hypothetical protein
MKLARFSSLQSPVARIYKAPTVVSAAASGYVTAGLVLNFDASVTGSYPGTGTNWTDTASSLVGAMGTGVAYSASSGGVMTFNGTTNAVVTVSGFTSLTNNFTLECWYQTSNNHPALWNSGTIGSQGFMMGYYAASSPANSWKATKYGVIDIYIGTIPQNTAWHQVTYTYSSTAGVSVYVDGAQTGTTVNNTSNLTAVTTNKIGLGESGNHNGSIGSIRMWNTVLSSTQVAQNFTAVRSKYSI